MQAAAPIPIPSASAPRASRVQPGLSGARANSVRMSYFGAEHAEPLAADGREAEEGAGYFGGAEAEGAVGGGGDVGEEGEDEDEDDEDDEDALDVDGRTPLDRTIDRIGMGSYQWILVSLCGLGWLADNMWLEAVAIALPRVQRHFDVSDAYIGVSSSLMFAGMMLGAVGWGTCSDMMGRTTAFNATLVLTALFGLLSSFAGSYVALCIMLFFLGSAVGGSMPTDGTLLLEYVPRGKQYLVTALSVFFSAGSVLAAVVALLVVPGRTCAPTPAPCDLAQGENDGWKYLLRTLGFITLAMFAARILLFRLHESPRYLVQAGRPQEALDALRRIAQFNGAELALRLADVDDTPKPAADRAPFLPASLSASAHAKAGGDVGAGVPRASAGAEALMQTPPRRVRTASETGLTRDLEVKDYDAMGESALGLDADSFATPTAPFRAPALFPESTPPVHPPAPAQVSAATPAGDAGLLTPGHTHTHAVPRRSRSRMMSNASRRSSFYEVPRRVGGALPRFVRRPLWAWLDRMAFVLSPAWRRTTVLVWIVWCAMALAYGIFNIFLPKLLETKGVGLGPKTVEGILWDVVIYTLGGCPGAILGAWMIETRLGRRKSLAASTFVTAVFCAGFVLVERDWAVRVSTIGISLSSTTMWSVLYGWTPEIFETEVRGTACGVASGLSRVGGMIAPLLGGFLLSINDAFPVYASIVIFTLAGGCVMMFSGHEGRGRSGAQRTVLH